MVELVGIGVIFIAGPLALAAWRDRRRAEADKIHAEVGWELARRVGGGLFSLRAVPGILRGGSVYLDGIGVPEGLRRHAHTVVEAMVPPGYRVVSICEAQGDTSPKPSFHFQEAAVAAANGTEGAAVWDVQGGSAGWSSAVRSLRLKHKAGSAIRRSVLG